MARDGSGVYSPPAGTLATPATPIESAKYNAFVNDLVADANIPRPLVAGGTGASTAPAALAALGLTATAAEINLLDGATVSTADLNILDGVTASTAELNILDGVTASTAELNFVDGVTSNIQTQLNGKTSSAAVVTLLEDWYPGGATGWWKEVVFFGSTINPENSLVHAAVASGTLAIAPPTSGEPWTTTGVRIQASASANSGYRFALADSPTILLNSSKRMKFRARVAEASSSLATVYAGLHRSTNSTTPAAPALYYELSNNRLKAIRVNDSGATTVADVASNDDWLVLDIEVNFAADSVRFLARKVDGTPATLIDQTTNIGTITISGNQTTACVVGTRSSGFAGAKIIDVFSLGYGYLS